MTFRKKWIAFLLVLLTAATLAACGEQQGGSIRVGVKADVTNFSLYDKESGGYSGMEIDLAQRICQDMGYSKVNFVTVTSSNREEMLDQDQVDMIIATFSINQDRLAKYDFSPAYYIDRMGIMVEDSSLITSITELKGCKIGVMKNTSHARLLAEYLANRGAIPNFDRDNFSAADFDGGVSFAEYDSYDAAARALEYGEVDAFTADRSILSGYRETGRTILPDEFSNQEYGVCTKKGSSLSKRVNGAVTNLLENGTIDNLKMKWGN